MKKYVFVQKYGKLADFPDTIIVTARNDSKAWDELSDVLTGVFSLEVESPCGVDAHEQWLPSASDLTDREDIE